MRVTHATGNDDPKEQNSFDSLLSKAFVSSGWQSASILDLHARGMPEQN
jgi:hypothetical protein